MSLYLHELAFGSPDLPSVTGSFGPYLQDSNTKVIYGVISAHNAKHDGKETDHPGKLKEILPTGTKIIQPSLGDLNREITKFTRVIKSFPTDDEKAVTAEKDKGCR